MSSVLADAAAVRAASAIVIFIVDGDLDFQVMELRERATAVHLERWAPHELYNFSAPLALNYPRNPDPVHRLHGRSPLSSQNVSSLQIRCNRMRLHATITMSLYAKKLNIIYL